MQAIETLGFVPNRAAQILQTKRSHTIEAVIPYHGFNRVLHAMARATNQQGYHFIISAIDPDEFEEAMASGRSRFIDGYILVPSFSITDDYEELLRLTGQVPFVQIGARRGANVPSVIYDQYEGARLATRHLIERGHRQIAEISGPMTTYDGLARHETWLKTLTDYGLETHRTIEADFSIDGGYNAMNTLLDRGDPFTGVFIANDSMAYGAHSALRQRGLRVPDDVSVVGFDNLEESGHFVPGLTTVHQDFDLMGRMAVEYIIDLIDNAKTAIHQRVLIPKLIVRDSTQPLT
jgi:DNA-binding LacI/PurR family transcriptional regulator